MRSIQVIGGGLAGTEAAWQLAEAGLIVDLFEMRPVRTTPAHQTDRLGELVCSNSLKSDQHPSASWLLKEELRRHKSVCLQAAERARVPGGHALTVDRTLFAEHLTGIVEAHPRIALRREEVTAVCPDAITIVATGPLTSDSLAQHISVLTGSERLYFYDSISPIVAGDSIDLAIAFRASRYGKSLDGTDDYLNCPFDKPQYELFLDALRAAEPVASHIPDDVPYFEACLPIEEIARRGPETLRFGPMKPMGLIDPRSGRRPYAVVQLRQETARADSWNLVGFQNHLKFGEQKRILRLIPGLEQAEFLRFGQIHRNTYINAPEVLNATMQMRAQREIFFAGQITGVEGYVESVAMGWLAGVNA
ncbi:MAG: methylenetetrahydrofolate--tRNA-(uracil(54)-C(5))-methyltransferase (FADH(2)-oxidizing) TrmFO, partial [Acidobacteriota bacterium]|nr:methylenetetrahydrofolate--tRNA-(uracil(54)-C(5))-methyltransferase (FADH(2)-oxidizing) TrmFO [Acidobacteriota bacterium]